MAEKINTLRVAPVVTATHRRRYVSWRCYEVSCAVLILTSGVFALYRLAWLGQP